MDKITHKKKVTIETQKIVEYKPTKNSNTESKVINNGTTIIKITPPNQNHKKKRGKMPAFLET